MLNPGKLYYSKYLLLPDITDNARGLDSFDRYTVCCSVTMAVTHH